MYLEGIWDNNPCKFYNIIESANVPIPTNIAEIVYSYGTLFTEKQNYFKKTDETKL